MANEVVSSDLENLAERIREEHQACFQSMRKGIEHALKVGELLVQARELVKHGDWTNWVEMNCEFTPRMARNYMKLAVNQDFLKTETISLLTLRDALDRVDFEVRKLGGGSVRRGKQEREEQKKRWKLEMEDSQVKQYLDVVKGFRKNIRDAVDVAEFGKFSPEGIRFTMRKHEELRRELDTLDEVFRKKLQKGKGERNV